MSFILHARGLAACGLVALSSLGGAAVAEGRYALAPWTPETSVNLGYYATDFSQPAPWPSPARVPGTKPPSAPDGVLFSPDRRYFMTLVYRGEVSSDSNLATIEVYSSEAVRRALRAGRWPAEPVRRLEMRSRSSLDTGAAMNDVRWDEDARAVLFEGFDDSGSRSLFRYEIASGRLEKLADLTAVPNRSAQYWSRAGSIVRRTGTRTSSVRADLYPAEWLDRGEEAPPGEFVYTLAARCGRGEERSIPTAFVPVRVELAPVGCLAMMQVATPGGPGSRRLVLLETDSMRMADVAPSGTRAAAFAWAPDGSRVAMTGSGQGDDAGLAVFDAASRRLEPTAGVPAGTIVTAAGLRWRGPDELLLSPQGRPALVIRRTADGWRAQAETAQAIAAVDDPGFTVAVEQDMNTPPRVVARSGSRAMVLSRPDPALAGIRRGNWREITWNEDGQARYAALLMPTANARDAGPPPLVVEVTHYDLFGPRGWFLPDGESKGSAAAAQALAARGFAVLRLDGWRWNADRSDMVARVPAEGSSFVDRLDRVIEDLARQRLIDPERVGLTGFSRAGWLTFYAATHPGRRRLAAYIAVDNRLGTGSEALTDALDGFPTEGLGNYVLDPETWRRHDTLFRADRVQAPILFTQNYWGRIGDRNGALVNPARPQLDEVFGSFVMARRPFDGLFFPYGVHQLQRPRERLVLANAIIDWMSFWLNGQLPADRRLAARWTRMRTDWQRQQAWEAAGNLVGSTPPADFRPGGTAGPGG